MKMLDEEQPRWLHKCVGDKQKMICFLALGVSKCHRAGLTFQAVQGLSLMPENSFTQSLLVDPEISFSAPLGWYNRTSRLHYHTLLPF